MRDNHRIREDIEVDELEVRRRDTLEDGVDSYTDRTFFVAYVIAAPLAYWGCASWLQNYAYRITFNPLFFVIPMTAVFLFSFVTIGLKAMKAAFSKPVNALRNE